MTNNPQGDFTPPEDSSSTPANNSGKTALFIAFGVGCGCLGLLTVVGILAAIALPSFLNQANRARETEALTNLGAMNRGQQAYYLEYGEFAPSLEAMNLGIPSESSFYTYEVVPQSDPTAVVYMTATPTEAEISAMSSAVFMFDGVEFNTLTIICRSNTFAAMPPALPNLDAANGVAYCPEGSATP